MSFPAPPELSAASGPFAGLAVLGDVAAATRATRDGIAERRARRLAQLLEIARRTPFYARLWQGIGDAAPLAALPPVSKSQLMLNFGAAVTDPQLNLAGLREFCADPQRAGRRFLGRYWVWQSSGSTGEPGIFVQDERAMAVYDALESLRRTAPRPWVRLWDPFYLGERYAFVGATDGHFASHVSLQRLRSGNPWLASVWRAFSVLQPIDVLVAQLDAFAPSVLATYPTAAGVLAEQARSGRLRSQLREVWTGGETLTPALRSHIEHGLGCALRNSYGASEFLPLAWECREQRLHLNADWVILEPVDAQGRAVAPGERSHTTLLTNLANHLQPLVRVDIGDQIVLDDPPCACGCALPVVDVLGRCDDVLVVPGRDGGRLSLLPLALVSLLEDEAGVFDFQLRQTGPRSLHLLLGPLAAREPEAAERCRRLLAAFAAAQGALAPRIAVDLVPTLPLGSSGKLQRIVRADERTFHRRRR